MWLAGAWIRPISEFAASYLGRTGVVFGPACAAIVVTQVTSGRDGVMHLLSRLRIRPNHLWWIGALPVITLAVTSVAFLATGTPRAALGSALLQGWPVLLAHYLVGISIVGLGEELGWRGWLLPRLLGNRNRGTATLLVATVWCLWHGPKLLTGGTVAATLVLISFALSFLFTALWSYTRESVFVVAAAHVAANTPMVFFESTVGHARALSAWPVVGVLYACLALVLILAKWSWWTEPPARRAREVAA